MAVHTEAAQGNISGAVVPTPPEDRATGHRATEEKRWAALYRALRYKVRALNSDYLGLNLSSTLTSIGPG